MSESSVEAESDFLVASPEQPIRHNGTSLSPTDNQQNQSTGSKRRKQNPPKKREKNRILEEIRKYQKSTDLLIPKSSFCRLLREIILNIAGPDIRLTLLSIQALQESSEMYMTLFLQDAYACTLHRDRVTLSISDMRLARFLRGPNDLANH